MVRAVGRAEGLRLHTDVLAERSVAQLARQAPGPLVIIGANLLDEFGLSQSGLEQGYSVHDRRPGRPANSSRCLPSTTVAPLRFNQDRLIDAGRGGARLQQPAPRPALRESENFFEKMNTASPAAAQWMRSHRHHRLEACTWSLYMVAVMFSPGPGPGPGEKGAAAAPQRGSLVSAPAKARD